LIPTTAMSLLLKAPRRYTEV